MKSNNQAAIYAGLAVVSWSTIATALKIALPHQTHIVGGILYNQYFVARIHRRPSKLSIRNLK